MAVRGPCRSRPRRHPRAPLVALLGVLGLAGCGGGDESAAPDPSPAAPEPSPIVRIAVAGPVDTLDPIFVDNRTERLISRQIHEPLVGRIDPPFNGSGTRRGPARPLGGEDGNRLWRFQLRPGVLFDDGAALNADAVLANHGRWVRTGVAARLLPELDAVDSPRPGEVRFQLSEPVSDFPRRLADPRLGLVSPDAFEGAATRPVAFDAGGTGPYEFRERQTTRMLLVRAPDWWGEGAGLGPGINQLDFVLTPGDVDRVEQLGSGSVSIADDLGALAVARLAELPLVSSVSEGSVAVGISGAVRGLSSVDTDQSLSELWLTTLR